MIDLTHLYHRFAATCLYTTTPDHDFILDRLPSGDSGCRNEATVSAFTEDVEAVPKAATVDGDIVFASCCSGHGFKFGPMLGDMAAAMVCLKHACSHV